MFLERCNPSCAGVETGLVFVRPNCVSISPMYSFWSIIRIPGCLSSDSHPPNLPKMCAIPYGHDLVHNSFYDKRGVSSDCKIVDDNA